MLGHKFRLLFCGLLVFNFLHGQDSTNYHVPKTEQKPLQDSTIFVANKWSSFVSVGVGKGYCGAASANGFAGTVSLAYKSHLFSLSGGGVYIPSGKIINEINYFEFGYMGFLFGEKIQYKHLYASFSAGVGYANLGYTVTDLKTLKSQYLKSGVSIPIEVKLFALSYKGVGVGLGVSKNFVINSKYAPLMITATFVLGNWASKKQTTSLNQ